MLRSSYESTPDQLRKCSGAVMKLFQISHESVLEQLVIVPEQLVSVPGQLRSLPE